MKTDTKKKIGCVFKIIGILVVGLSLLTGYLYVLDRAMNAKYEKQFEEYYQKSRWH